jgi:hypothetical protein
MYMTGRISNDSQQSKKRTLIIHDGDGKQRNQNSPDAQPADGPRQQTRHRAAVGHVRERNVPGEG